MLPAVCFIAAHPNPASHFAEYIQNLEQEGICCKIIAESSVKEKFSALKSRVSVIDLSNLDKEEVLLSEIEKEIASQSIVITDIATRFWDRLHQRLAERHPAIIRAVYYDNPESQVPGEYSKIAAEVIANAQGVLFANADLAKKGVENDVGEPIDLSGKERVAIGYYPRKEAEDILHLKKQPELVAEVKSAFFARHNICGGNPKIFVYAGGANSIYYEKAFPCFIELVSQLLEREDSPLQDTVIVLQQHPRAAKEGNKDAKLAEKLFAKNKLPPGFHFVVSDMPNTLSLAIADGVFYYQTSMAPQFVFANIPLIAQIGHEKYEDALMRAGFPFALTAGQLEEILSARESKNAKVFLEKELGIDPSWQKNISTWLKEKL
ncbi:MAG: hypothetical protein Tsb0015_05910 [Simkaniaceae bacterium]